MPDTFTPYDRDLRWTLTVPATRATAWRQWTTVAGLRQFFGVDHRVDFEPGGRFEILFLLDEPAGRQGSESCRILCWEPESRLVFTWNAPPHIPACRPHHTVVEVRFASTPAATCELELVHRGFGIGPDWDRTFAYFQAAWPRVLNRFEASCQP